MGRGGYYLQMRIKEVNVLGYNNNLQAKNHDMKSDRTTILRPPTSYNERCFVYCMTSHVTAID